MNRISCVQSKSPLFFLLCFFQDRFVDLEMVGNYLFIFYYFVCVILLCYVNSIWSTGPKQNIPMVNLSHRCTPPMNSVWVLHKRIYCHVSCYYSTTTGKYCDTTSILRFKDFDGTIALVYYSVQPSIFCHLSLIVNLLKDNSELDLKTNRHGLQDTKRLMLSLKKVALMKHLIYKEQKPNTYTY